MMKKIGFYVADVDPEHTSSIGIYRVTMNILKGLIVNNINTTIFCSEDNFHQFNKFKSKNINVCCLKKVSNSKLIDKLLWNQIIINKYAKKEKVDILFFPKGPIPIYKCKPIQYWSIIHDLIPFYYVLNKKSSISNRFKYIPMTLLLIKSAISSDKIFTVSNYSKTKIMKFTTEKKIKVIPTGFGLAKPLDKLTLKTKNIKEKPYFYIIGNRNPHKNLERSIDLFIKYNSIHNNKYNAIITSEKIGKYKDINEIIFLRRVNERELATIYKNAKLSLFLSDIEGFGLPLIESYSLNTPVVFNNKTSLKEIGNNLVGKCNINDEKSVFRAIDDVLKMNKQDIYKYKIELEKKYNWKNCVLNVIEEI